ncbi:concanavalin A-like lectin/glucanase [Lentinus tigrinus ALCF2SS1-7]|uniref:Concanavalin A-like lectin/glucanase n=1 Tax=Lentinus tigrinus ALCF2SS1-6 TaxID=1328759 RepID=A0A5C2SF62_9APHY|nr:concanavalin A-like lectin/glucanase [Lentinus tigrinus ALCF2SS1-6]RPD77810.1 concanavalin A-like lectin/glucanase [Lentinus tigrinus ALCF2SS1-7]
MISTALLALLPLVGAKTLSVDFSTYDSSNMTVSEFLASKGLMINTYDVDTGGDPYTHTYEEANVGISGGYLTLKVTGGTKSGSTVPSACIQTNDSNILHGTFKTTAIASDVAGVCHGFYTYESDSQESDIEILTSHLYSGNDAVNPGLQLTNQAINGNSSDNTRKAIAYPSDPTSGEHEYKLQWSSGLTEFFFDGSMVASIDTNVPTAPSAFLWNSWSGGNPNWTEGPPTEDAILRISKIELDYETS